MKNQITARDHVLDDFELPLGATFHPLGFSLEIATNSEELLEGARESWDRFRRRFSAPPVHLRIMVLDGGPEECPEAPLIRVQHNFLTNVASAENFTVCDMRQGTGFGWLTKAVVRNRAYLRYYFLEAAAWCLLHPPYLANIHAACVSLDGKGVLLCGDSGAGKSTLAYACARSGWTFLSDDVSCLVRGRRGRVVVGNPHGMRFRETAVGLFPELKNQRVTPRATGELAIELETASLPGIATTSESRVDYVVFLNRAPGAQARFRPFPKEKAFQWFGQSIVYGEADVRAAQKESMRELLKAQVVELRYSDLEAAIEELESLVRDTRSVYRKSSMTSAVQDNA
jgi:hypothetical protein